MSFILDALKKLERQKQEGDPSQSGDQPVMVGGRRWGEKRAGSAFGWGSVIVAVAALIVAGLALYRSLAPSAATSSNGALPTAPASSPPESSAPDTSATGAESKDMGEPEPESPPGSSRESPPRGTPASDDGKSEPEQQYVEELGESELDEIETSPPVRLIGRPRGERTPEEKSEEPAALTSEIPEGLPELVLQGTSVVDGKSIAVVNYQRLFEGDTIEGARVIRITDRFVELEYEGKRFTLKF